MESAPLHITLMVESFSERTITDIRLRVEVNSMTLRSWNCLKLEEIPRSSSVPYIFTTILLSSSRPLK
jgi:hypothetical protein